jgi:hypothetical protein
MAEIFLLWTAGENRLSGYALMARMIDNGSASIEGHAGDYHGQNRMSIVAQV